MSFLSAAQSASIRLIGKKPSTFFSSQNTFEMEIIDLANEVVTDMVKYADWRRLITLQQMVGDGVTYGFDLPDDYDRMPIGVDISRANWYTWGYVDAPSLNYWMDLVNGLASPNPGYWIMLDGQIQFRPAVSASTTAQFFYVSKNAVLDADGTTKKPAFTKDEDTYLLDERVLKLGIIYKWRAQKRLEYAQDFSNYEQALMQASGHDKGARITKGANRASMGAYTAYPWALGS
jgi:hypothetical protein